MGIWLLTTECHRPNGGGLLRRPDFGVIWCFFLNILFHFYSTVLIVKHSLGEFYKTELFLIRYCCWDEQKYNLYNLAELCFSARAETSSAPSTDFAEETSSQSTSTAAEWINH